MNNNIEFNGATMDISSNVNTNGYWWRNFIAKNILSKKYYHDKELEQFNKGNEDLAFKMFVERVSGIFSNTDLQMFMAKSLYTGNYILAGRSLYGAGAKGKFKSSMSNCFTKGHKVITKRGLVNIEDVVKGDIVLTHTGDWQLVNAVMERDYDGDLIKFKVQNGYDGITCTPNHKFLTDKGWVTAEHLTFNHKIMLTPINQQKDYIGIKDMIIVKNQHCKVYNLSVENDNSYTVNGVVCHNCYILDKPNDKIESIFDVAKRMARIFSFGGGCGIDISNLRPANTKVNNVARTSTGAVSFMNLYSAVGETIAQNSRRGALLIALDCNHPDIEEFLTIKQNNDKVQGANISIKFTDEFMNAVHNESDVKLYFKVNATGEEITKTINAKEFFKKFCKAQYDYAEPGAIFIDTVRNWHLLSEYEDYKIDVSNPCSEYFGNEHQSCNLSSVNLYNFVLNPFTEKARFNYIKFKQCLHNAVYIANEVLDYGYDTQPLDENRKCIDDWRSIGIGVFGLADMFIALGIKYGSKESKDVLKSIMKTMQNATLWASSKYAKEYTPFGKYDRDKTITCPYILDVLDEDKELKDHIYKYGLANGTILSIAPTGSIAMLFRESGGVEPYYKVSYERTTHQLEKQNKKFFISMLAVEDMLKYHKHADYSEKHIKEAFPFVVDTYDINPRDRIDIQAIMQDYVDNAISSTINLKEEATVQDIYDLYMYAWKSCCKGITIFRDNCKRISILGKDHGKTRDDKTDSVISEDDNKTDVVVAKNTTTETDIINPTKLNSIVPIKRGNVKSLWGRTFLYHTACVPKFYVTVNIKDNEIFEVFVGADKGCQANISTITRMTSLALRSGVTVEEIVKNLNSAVCPACTNARYKGDKTIAKSCASCIASAIVEMQETLNGGKNNPQAMKGIVIQQPSTTKKLTMNIKPMMKCPECGEPTLIPDGKCAYCSNCGYSKCD